LNINSRKKPIGMYESGIKKYNYFVSLLKYIERYKCKNYECKEHDCKSNIDRSQNQGREECTLRNKHPTIWKNKQENREECVLMLCTQK